MKVKPKTSAANGTARVSALQRLTQPNSTGNSVHQRLGTSANPMVTDARQLLSNRNKPVFDARQLLSRQTSKTNESALIIRRDMESDDDDEELEEDEQPQTMVLQRSATGRLTAGSLDRLSDKKKNPFVSTEPISFTKTVSNKSQARSAPAAPSPDQKFVISFSNDQYRKRARSPSPTPPPVIKRMSNPTSISRLSTQRDADEPPKKKQQSLTTTSKTSLKPKSNTTDGATILITNLPSTVVEEDIEELFSEIGPINEIKTLSHGCIQVIYTKEDHAQQAVANYHNRLLDGQLMYVSLQQPSFATKSSKSSSSSSSSAKTEVDSSKKYSFDPAFFRQALFNSSSSSDKNPVQFQVKL